MAKSLISGAKYIAIKLSRVIIAKLYYLRNQAWNTKLYTFPKSSKNVRLINFSSKIIGQLR